MENARSAALRVLLRVDRDEGYSNIVLDHTLVELSLNQQDKALATALVYGVLERRITLDWAVGRFSNTPLKKLSPKVLELLRMGFYQLLYMEKIPPSAAVNESVKLARECGVGKSSGFVNAVLRSFLRAEKKFPLPDTAKEPLKYLSVKYSCPEWLVSLWRASYGEVRAEKLLAALSDKPDVFARVNNTLISEAELLDRMHEEGLKAERVEWLPNAVRLENPGEIAGLSSYREGLFHVQDLSSQLCCYLLGAKAGEIVADVCSAPGGKAFTIAEGMENNGTVFACDKYENRVKLIREGVERLHLSSIRTAVRDAEGPGADHPSEAAPFEAADCVLCDAPCSGLGVLRRKPEIRYKLAPTIDSLPDLQYRILCKSSELVKVGGTLLYSTCTLNPQENSGVARRLLADFPGFEPASLTLPDGFLRDWEEPENELTMMPHANGTDGFFVAKFRRKQ